MPQQQHQGHIDRFSVSRWGIGFLWGFVVLGVPAIWYWNWNHHPASAHMLANHDAKWYWDMAHSLAAGNGWAIEGQAPFPPAYAAWLSCFISQGLNTEQSFQLSTLSLWLTFAITSTLFLGLRRAALLMAMFLFLPIRNCYLMPWSEVLALPLLGLSVALVSSERSKVDGQRGKWYQVGLFLSPKQITTTIGVLLGLLTITRWAGGYFMLLLPLVMVTKGKLATWPSRLVLLWYAYAPASLIIGFVLWQNYAATDHLLGYDRLVTDLSVSTISQWGKAVLDSFSWLKSWPKEVGAASVSVWLLGQLVQWSLVAWAYKTGWLSIPRISLLLLAMGYALFLFFMEHKTELDVVDYRLLAPMIVVLWAAAITGPVKSASTQDPET